MTDASKTSGVIAAAAPDATVSAPKTENAVPAGDAKAEAKTATPEQKPVVAPVAVKI
jgi:hypothetical protein